MTDKKDHNYLYEYGLESILTFHDGLGEATDFVNDLGFQYEGKIKELIQELLAGGYCHESNTDNNIHNNICPHHLNLVFKKKHVPKMG